MKEKILQKISQPGAQFTVCGDFSVFFYYYFQIKLLEVRIIEIR